MADAMIRAGWVAVVLSFLLKCDEFVKNSCNFAPELGDALAL
jgi:hypothetical protein